VAPRNRDSGCVEYFFATKGNNLLEGFILMNGKADVSVLNGSIDTVGGWYSAHYGHKVPTCILSARVKTDLQAVALTAVKPGGSSLCFAADEVVPLIPAAAGELLLAKDSRGFVEMADSTTMDSVED